MLSLNRPCPQEHCWRRADRPWGDSGSPGDLLRWWSTTSYSLLLPPCHPSATSTLHQRVPDGWRHNPKAAPVKDQGPRGSVALCFAMKVTSVLQHKAPEPTTLTAHILGTKNRLGLKEEHPGRWIPKSLEIPCNSASYRNDTSLEILIVLWQIILLPFRKAVKCNIVGCVFAHIY